MSKITGSQSREATEFDGKMEMEKPVIRMRKPDKLQEFRWLTLLRALIISASIMFVFGLVMDNTLRLFGVGISAWLDALWDSLLAIFCGFFLAPVFWRIGLVTFSQYMLGAFALVVPIAGTSFAVLSQFYNVWIEVPGIDSAAYPDQHIAITAYVRLIRAMVFVPIFLAAFYWVFHIVFAMAPRQNTNE